MIKSTPIRNCHDSDTLRLVLDKAAIPVNYCSKDLVILFANKPHAELHGLDQDWIIGRTIPEVLGEEANEAIRPYYERALRGERVVYEMEVNFKMGLRYIQCIYTPVASETGEIVGWVGVIYDMTQRYLLERRLLEHEQQLRLAKEKAEAANIAKTEFLANMSHEIRTPMNAIVGLASILSESDPLNTRQREYVQTLKMSADLLLALINDLLGLSKIETQAIVLERIPLSLTQLVREVTEMMSVRAREKGLAFTLDAQAVENVKFIGDPTRLRQVLLNLCSNAIKFNEKGGVHILIDSAPGERDNVKQVRILIRDTGIGVPQDKLENIFEKFVQADSTISRKYGGTGLGLAITKTLIEMMGGRITVESVVGKGSEFTLWIPLECAVGGELPLAKEKNVLPERQPPVHLPRVLVVEDCAANVLVAGAFLEEFGYAYDLANDGLEAVEKVKREHYLAVLMDVQMHVMNGLEATQRIREYERHCRKAGVHIIGMTAYAMAGDREHCLAAGMNDYISKPFNPNELKNKLAQLAATAWKAA
jgi:PAS domain S-box-containing protein